MITIFARDFFKYGTESSEKVGMQVQLLEMFL